MPPAPAAPAPSTSASPPGADVFISYARENRDVAAQLADALTARGLRVWWDRDLIAGSRFSERIEAELQRTRWVLTLWSDASIRSGFVRDESTRALDAGKLIPLRIQDVPLPLGFGQLHTLDLLDWDGDANDARLAEVFTALTAHHSAEWAAPPQPPRPPPRPTWRRSVVAGAVVLLIVASGAGWWKQHADTNNAEGHFNAGVERQFATEPNLESARNHYLSTLALRPEHARARFYLGHVYAQLGQNALAKTAFEQALGHPEQLDAGQRTDAQRLVGALSSAVEPTALTTAHAAAPPETGGARPPPSAVAVTMAASDAAQGTSPATAIGAEPSQSTTNSARLPPRVAPSDADLARLNTRVAGLFEGDGLSRSRATTDLVLDPQALSDAAPLALARALPLARAQAQHDLSGVINTLLLLQNSMPATLLTQRADIEQLVARARPQGEATRTQADKLEALLRAATGQRPRAYIQIANAAQRPLAEALAQRLRDRGYSAPDIEQIGQARSPQHSEVRVQGKSDRGLARWLVKVMDEFTVDPPRLSTLKNAQPSVDTYEIWLGAGLCTTTMVARCRVTPE